MRGFNLEFNLCQWIDGTRVVDENLCEWNVVLLRGQVQSCKTVLGLAVDGHTACWAQQQSYHVHVTFLCRQMHRTVSTLHNKRPSMDLRYRWIALRCGTIVRWLHNRLKALRDQQTHTRSLALINRRTAVVHNRVMALYRAALTIHRRFTTSDAEHS